MKLFPSATPLGVKMSTTSWLPAGTVPATSNVTRESD